ncbi:ester cyclase [Quadrisphaera sp. DSM 44207]|uniref:ester cyclase n=1 Tax=Quadrisphaera sp. DSM 44207 TaxID=1881057 RepID=UPI0008820D63|nr:ester cyclase [Quadrisphaera sp. DSM 44207]SDQ66767.1 conserved hypothetical protein, steroid delta-isomerase-related [Quadrisphaera sp. DSM 44207]
MEHGTGTSTGGRAEENVAVVRDLIARFFNGHDTSIASRFFTPDLHWHGGSVGDVRGREDYAAVMDLFFTALPDVQATEQQLIADEDQVAARFTVTGTHRGALWGLEPSGERVEWLAIMTYRFVDGRIAEQWAAEDWVAILRDVGALTPPWVRTGIGEPAR